MGEGAPRLLSVTGLMAGGSDRSLKPFVVSESLQVLLAHYLELSQDGRLPSRQDIDATRLGPVLSMVWVNEYVPETGTFRYRLAGEEVNAIFGASVAGRLLSDFVVGDRFEPVNSNFLRIIGQQVAMVASGPIYRCTDRIALGERLALPLSSDGVTADGIIGATACARLTELDKASMREQKTVFVPIAELLRGDDGQEGNADPTQPRAFGGAAG